VAEVQLSEPIESVLERADQALYTAKEAERDRTHFGNGRKLGGIDNYRLMKEAALVRFCQLLLQWRSDPYNGWEGFPCIDLSTQY